MNFFTRVLFITFFFFLALPAYADARRIALNTYSSPDASTYENEWLNSIKYGDIVKGLAENEFSEEIVYDDPFGDNERFANHIFWVQYKENKKLVYAAWSKNTFDIRYNHQPVAVCDDAFNCSRLGIDFSNGDKSENPMDEFKNVKVRIMARVELNVAKWMVKHRCFEAQESVADIMDTYTLSQGAYSGQCPPSPYSEDCKS
jgi:hypothetical protein